MTKTVTIFGATGAQGAPVAAEAIAKGLTVRAVGRDADKIKKMHPDAEAFAAPLEDEDAVVAVLDGVDAAFLHLPAPKGPDDSKIWLTSFITAAHKTSLPLMVYTTGGPTGPRYASSNIIDGGTAGMQAILGSGVPAIVLQPAIYLENLLPEAFVPRLRTEGILDYPPMSAKTKVQWTSHIDQARVAVAALLRPDLAGESYEIGTPEALTGPELAELVEKWIGRSVAFAPLSPKEFGARVGDAFDSPGMAFALGDLYGALAQLSEGQMTIDTKALENTFNVKLTTVAEHLANWPKA